MELIELLVHVSRIAPKNLQRLEYLAERVDWRRSLPRLERNVLDTFVTGLGERGLPTTKGVVRTYLSALRSAGRYLSGEPMTEERLKKGNFRFVIVRLLRHFGINSFLELACLERPEHALFDVREVSALHTTDQSGFIGVPHEMLSPLLPRGTSLDRNWIQFMYGSEFMDAVSHLGENARRVLLQDMQRFKTYGPAAFEHEYVPYRGNRDVRGIVVYFSYGICAEVSYGLYFARVRNPVTNEERGGASQAIEAFSTEAVFIFIMVEPIGMRSTIIYANPFRTSLSFAHFSW